MSHRGAPDRDDVTWVWLLWSELPAGEDRPGRRPTGRIAGPSHHLLLGCPRRAADRDSAGITPAGLGPPPGSSGVVTVRSIGRPAPRGSRADVTSSRSRPTSRAARGRAGGT